MATPNPKTESGGKILEMEIAGMNEVEDILATMREYGATQRGAAFLGSQRKENGAINNADILKWQAERYETRPARDILPNQEDANKAAKVFADRLMDRIRTIAKTNPTFGKADGKQSPGNKREAGAAVASALTAACKFIAKLMSERLEKQVDSNGAGLEKVTDDYARARSRKYGVSEDAVLKASGQLAENLARGTVKITK